MTAGTTFFGQFLDHDMTFDATSPLGVPTAPESTTNVRTPVARPRLGLRRWPDGEPELYQSDRVKLRIESGGLFEDVPRNANGTAIIGDPRNDENVIISGLQAAFILAHNRVVDLAQQPGRSRPASSSRRPGGSHLALPVDHRARVPAADHRRRR